MFCNTETEQFQEALKYADVLFNKIPRDSASLSYMDYVYYGNALNGDKQHEAAIAQYENALKMDFDNLDKKAGVVKTLSDAYKGMKDYDNAIKYYKQYMDDVSQVSANDYVGLATLYRQSTSVKDEAGQIEALNMTDKVYEEMIAKFPASEDYATLQRANLKAALDPNMEQGLAKPLFERLIEIINARPEKDATDVKRLVTSYQYMMSYFSINKDAAKALEYAKKIYELQPDNQGIKETIDALSKAVK
jgi:tetratricopeptide (TPR) repeat protein